MTKKILKYIGIMLMNPLEFFVPIMIGAMGASIVWGMVLWICLKGN